MKRVLYLTNLVQMRRYNLYREENEGYAKLLATLTLQGSAALTRETIGNKVRSIHTDSHPLPLQHCNP